MPKPITPSPSEKTPAPRKKRVAKSAATTITAAPVGDAPSPVKKRATRKKTTPDTAPPATVAETLKPVRKTRAKQTTPTAESSPPPASAVPSAHSAPAIPAVPPPSNPILANQPPDAVVEKGRGEGVIRVSHYPPYQQRNQNPPATENSAAHPPQPSTTSSYPPYHGGGQNRPQGNQGQQHPNQQQGGQGGQRDGRRNRRDRGRRNQRNQPGDYRDNRNQPGDNRDNRNQPGDNRDNRDNRDPNAAPERSQEEPWSSDANNYASYDNYEETEAPQPQPANYEPVFADGLVEVSPKGFGFLRESKKSYVQSPSDIFVTPEVIRRYLLRDGHFIKGETRRGSRGPQLFKLTEINGEDPEKYTDILAFEELVSINPDQRIKLETVPDRYTTRVIDLIAPIGKGQRGIIVAPPRSGKTTILQHIADGVIKNHPSMKLIILLVDERPEEVTEIRRAFPQAEIMASSNDGDLKAHTRICQLAIERAKRLVEAEEDVFILLDSITRVARAFNNATSGGGRTGSGGLDTRAMEIPRRLFAAARNTEQAGSLTIIATALVDTGSLMDEVIFQEFKGTGNMELVLDRKIAEQRIYPAVDIFKSGTRREELILPAHDLEKINTIRRGLAGHRPGEAIERLLSFLRKFPTNAQMLREIPNAT